MVTGLPWLLPPSPELPLDRLARVVCRSGITIGQWRFYKHILLRALLVSICIAVGEHFVNIRENYWSFPPIGANLPRE